MAGKRANGEGSISYDSRRKRYRAKITVGWELNEETGRTKQIVKTLGSNFKTKGEASAALSEYLKNPYDINNKDIIEVIGDDESVKACLDDILELINSTLYKVKELSESESYVSLMDYIKESLE